ncbi:hypothetical protein ACRAWD_17710 [Caulobacter segnis]
MLVRDASMARRSAYSPGFGSCDIAKPNMPVLLQGEFRFHWGRAAAVALCLTFWAGVMTLIYAALA